jgi:hypothetical protein
MDEVKARTLRPYERRKLKSMKQQLTNRLHAAIILSSRRGDANAQIARQRGCFPAMGRRIMHRFSGGGINTIIW